MPTEDIYVPVKSISGLLDRNLNECIFLSVKRRPQNLIFWAWCKVKAQFLNCSTALLSLLSFLNCTFSLFFLNCFPCYYIVNIKCIKKTNLEGATARNWTGHGRVIA